MDHWISACVFLFAYGTLAFGLYTAAKDIVALLSGDL